MFALVFPVLSPKENRKLKGDAACGDAKCDMGDWRNGIRGKLKPCFSLGSNPKLPTIKKYLTFSKNYGIIYMLKKHRK